LAASSTSNVDLLLAAGSGNTPAPAWSNALFAVAAVVLVAGVAALFFVKNRRVERRIYWSTLIIGSILLAAALLHRGWGIAVTGFAAFMFGGVFYAYMRTPYLKIGTRIYAFSIPDSRPDPQDEDVHQEAPPMPPRDSYLGVVTARNFWWLVVALNCGLAYGVYAFGWRWQTIAYTAGFALFVAVCGVDDATRKLPIARGQHVQAFVALAASILLWLIPPIVYLLAYQVGKRWPMGYGLHDQIARHYRDKDDAEDA
jgi:hypothetical protein